MPTILIPTPLRKFAGNASKVEAQGATVEAAILDLTVQFPELRKQLLDDAGQIRSFLRIYKGEDDIRTLNEGLTPLEPGTVVSIIPAIAGGAA
jgi:molybdopterin synthase sulfur carrier subunit